ncbi:TRAF3-interacting protein 1 [Pararge aegeria]|uniref:TRAF3-interacting protein 1 n=1 Tax=Pararge aegeria TaxID=116150 RepID=UPI0019D18B18|nr:TRAF3-interacting protein 1 [Pararge aegeria]
MEKGMNSDIVKATQISLGKYVKRPQLTDKLLKKPPFRFLHDIITSVLNSTGFFSGLFDEEELISDNVKDRESKILFLSKIITVVSTTTGKPLSAKPSKIIAGQEPEKTNELLQCLALALENNLSSDESVRIFKDSAKLNTPRNKITNDVVKSPVKKSIDSRKVSSKNSDKSTKLVKSDNISTKLKQRESNNVRKEPKKALVVASKVTTKKISEKVKHPINPIKSVDDVLNSVKNEEIQNNVNSELALDQHLELAAFDSHDDLDVTPEFHTDSNNCIAKEHSPAQETSRNEYEHEEQTKIENTLIDDNLSNDNSIVLTLADNQNDKDCKEETTNSNNQHKELTSPRKTEVENIKKKKENTHRNEYNSVHPPETNVTETSHVKRPSSVRPSSSRPGAPRLREKHDSILTSAENLVGGKVNIIAEKTVSEEEEDEPTIIIMDKADTIKNIEVENAHLQATPDQHGHLVQQILDAQKEFTQAAGRSEIEWQYGAQKARDLLHQEIELIRFNVQALSRVANPLGKLLDHIQEDVEVMRQELNQWLTSYELASQELLKQKVANEQYLLPLYARKKQLDVDIAEKHDKINDLKIIIHKNASRIDKLLSSGSI